MSSAPASLTVIAEGVEQRLRALLEAEIERWRALDPEIVAPLESLSALLLAGGKRLRPAFCHWGFVGAGGDADDPVVADARAAFELLHAFALIHDDVMDGSSTRARVRTGTSSRDSAHARRLAWRSEKVRRGRRDPHGRPRSRLRRSVPSAPNAEAMAVWHELRIELNVGQYLDIVGTARTDEPPGCRAHREVQVRQVHGRAAAASRRGARGRFGDLAPALSPMAFLGDAFQLRDDMLGALDEALTGKPVGDDLREGKPTPMLAIAASRAGKQHAELLHRVGAPDLDEHEVAALQAVIVDTGAQAEAEAAITALTEQAVGAIAEAPVTAGARDELIELRTTSPGASASHAGVRASALRSTRRPRPARSPRLEPGWPPRRRPSAATERGEREHLAGERGRVVRRPHVAELEERERVGRHDPASSTPINIVDDGPVPPPASPGPSLRITPRTICGRAPAISSATYAPRPRPSTVAGPISRSAASASPISTSHV
jgi:geranylgeranyl diphosphate synthase type I